MISKPKLAVFKFASCDGCQLSLLDCEDELLAVADRWRSCIFWKRAAGSRKGPTTSAWSRVRSPRPPTRRGFVRCGGTRSFWSPSAPAPRLAEFRPCGIGPIRASMCGAVYARPEYISTLATSTAIAEHVAVDFELRGCPIDKHQLLEVIAALLNGRRPRTPSHSVCLDCKRRGTVCVMVAGGRACLGPVTHSGCGAICPAYDRGCYGCFGPAAQANLPSMTYQLQANGLSRDGSGPAAARHQRLCRRVPRGRGSAGRSSDPGCARSWLILKPLPAPARFASKP